MNQYESYKESGVDWLGKIPTHWDSKRLKQLVELNPGKAEVTDIPDSTEVSFLPMERIGEDGSIDLSEVRPLSAIQSGYTYCRENDVIVAKITPCFENGKGALCKGLKNNIAFGSTEFIVLRAAQCSDPRFIYYVTKSDAFMKLGEAGMTGSAGQKRISDFFVSNFRLAAPNNAEQRSIACYLDKDIARIDQLIANKRQQINKLGELRQITISRAVTRGLDSTAPIKDSGIDWLGEVPAHWQVSRVKRYTISMEQGWSPQCEARTRHDGEWGVLKVGCVNGTTFNAEEHKALPRNLDPRPEYEIKKDDILISRANTRQLLGNACLVEKAYPRLMLCDKLYRLRLQQNRLTNEFLVYYLGTFIARYQIEREATGTSGSMQNIGQDTIKGLQVAVPPIDEQGHIVKFMQEEAKKFDSLTSSTNKQIEKLEELRKITINDAVTGKVKVTD